jgi:hypothetical protein
VDRWNSGTGGKMKILLWGSKMPWEIFRGVTIFNDAI